MILNRSTKELKVISGSREDTKEKKLAGEEKSKTLMINSTNLKSYVSPDQAKNEQELKDYKNMYKYINKKSDLTKLVKYFETD